jgi:hypothetical protein
MRLGKIKSNWFGHKLDRLIKFLKVENLVGQSKLTQKEEKMLKQVVGFLGMALTFEILFHLGMLRIEPVEVLGLHWTTGMLVVLVIIGIGMLYFEKGKRHTDTFFV